MAGYSGIRYKCISLISHHYYITYSLNIKNYQAIRDKVISMPRTGAIATGSG